MLSQADIAGLLEQQRQLEALSSEMGTASHHRKVAKAIDRGESTQLGARRKILAEAVWRTADTVNEVVLEAMKQRGNRHTATTWVAKLGRVILRDELGAEKYREQVTDEKAIRRGADTAGYLTVKAFLDTLSLDTPLKTVARNISQLIVDEMRFRRLHTERPKTFNYQVTRTGAIGYVHLASVMNLLARDIQLPQDDIVMSDSHRLLVGIKLLDCMIAANQLASVVSRRVIKTTANGSRRMQPRQEQLLVPAADVLEWIANREERLACMSPVHMPMLVPPLRWTPKQDGGYRFQLLGTVPLIRGPRRYRATDAAEIRNTPVVYAALNAVQETPWKVNGSILEVVHTIRQAGQAVAGLGATATTPEPPKPPGLTKEDKVACRQYRNIRHQWHVAERQRRAKALSDTQTIMVAEQMKDAGAFYFPYNLDFRGRLYPVASYLSPQGDDLARSLLIFAEGKPLTPMGAYHLSLHGANCLGTTPQGRKLSRETLTERATWIETHTEAIRDVAREPWEHRWWQDADKPLQFLAFCIEWAAYSDAVDAGNGDTFISTLPVYADGSCNGLQHLAAAWRDEDAGRAVNVTPNAQPADIYQDVTTQVLDDLEREASEGSHEAVVWLASGLVDRSLCKRPTMTYVYGSRQYGFANQIREHVRLSDLWWTARQYFISDEAKAQAGLSPTGLAPIPLNVAVAYLARVIYGAVSHVTVRAGLAMDWMQKAAQKVAKAGRPVSWRVPATDFTVVQRYFAYSKRQVETMLAGQLVCPAYYQVGTKVAKHKQRNAVAPNVVHSLDAAALMLTIKEAQRKGVTSFGMVHDSYGTLASDAPKLAEATRTAFYRLYTEQDVVAHLHQEWLAQAGGNPASFPPPPEPGNLDLTGVLHSDYFFS